MSEDSCTDQTVVMNGSPRGKPPLIWLGDSLGTFFVMFLLCGLQVNLEKSNAESDGDSVPYVHVLVWFLSIPLPFMIYLLGVSGPFSGAHLNPAVTINFAIFRGFPWKEVPMFVVGQLVGSIFCSGVIRFCFFDAHDEIFFGTVPAGSNVQSFVVEFGISFLLMFVICGVADGYKLEGEKAAVAVGATVLLNVCIFGQISGASMNPARTLGPAIVFGRFEGLWIYIFGPLLGCICGALAHNLMISIENSFTNNVSSKETIAAAAAADESVSTKICCFGTL